MNIDMTGLASLIVSIGTLVGFLLTRRKLRAEASANDASAAEKYEQMAGRVATRMAAVEKENEANREKINQLKDENIENRKKIKRLEAIVAEQDTKIVAQEAKIKAQEAEITVLRKSLDEATEKIDCLEIENGDLRKWAERLVKRIYELGGTPPEVERK